MNHRSSTGHRYSPPLNSPRELGILRVSVWEYSGRRRPLWILVLCAWQVRRTCGRSHRKRGNAQESAEPPSSSLSGSLRKASAAEGFLRKNVKKSRFPGPPGPGPGAGPGARQKSELPAGFPNFDRALRPAPLTLPQRARNGAKQPPPGKLTIRLFPLALLIGESCQNPGFFSHFSGKRGAPGAHGAGKCAGFRKIKNPEEFPGQTGTPGTFPPEKSPESRKKSRGGRVRRDFSRTSKKFPEKPPRRRDSSGKK